MHLLLTISCQHQEAIVLFHDKAIPHY